MGVGWIVEVDAAFEHGVRGYTEVAADRGHGRGRARKSINGHLLEVIISSAIYCLGNNRYEYRAESWQLPFRIYDQCLPTKITE